MLSTDREQFEVQLATLCAGYNLPVTKHRQDAYWSSLRKMSIVQFSRVVEVALGEDGPDDLPSARVIWKLHQQMRSSAPAMQTSAKRSVADHLEYHANRLLITHMGSRGGIGPEELAACLKFKRSLVNWYLSPVREGDPDATPAEFLRQWIAGLQNCGSRIEKSTNDRWCEMLDDERLAKPFDPAMGRDLTAKQLEFG